MFGFFGKRNGLWVTTCLVLFLLSVSVFCATPSEQPINHPTVNSSAHTPAQSSSESESSSKIATYTLWLTIFTGVLALVGIVQFFFLIRADKTARTSADAAKISADNAKATTELARKEFLSTNRPRIRVKHLWITQGISNKGPLSVTLVMVNRGDTYAEVNELRIGFYLTGGEGAIADKFLEARPRIPASLSVNSGLTIELQNMDGGLELTDQQRMFARAGNMRLYCVGDIQYVDELNRPRKTAFARKLINDRLVPLEKPDPDYDYED